MKTLVTAATLCALTVMSPFTASAADFGGDDYEDDGYAVVREAPPPIADHGSVIVRERIVERTYVQPRHDYDNAPVVYYEPRFRRPQPFAASFDDGYRWGPRPYRRWHNRRVGWRAGW